MTESHHLKSYFAMKEAQHLKHAFAMKEVHQLKNDVDRLYSISCSKNIWYLNPKLCVRPELGEVIHFCLNMIHFLLGFLWGPKKFNKHSQQNPSRIHCSRSPTIGAFAKGKVEIKAS